MITLSRGIKYLVALMSLTLMAACGSGGGGGLSPTTAGNSTVGAPDSIIGKTAVLTVTKNDGSATIIGVGKQITYSFVDANTILGKGLVTIPTESWSYVLNKNVATINMQMSVGWSEDFWTFTSPTEGTYHSDTGLVTGTSGWHEGTFTISDYTDGTTTGGTTTGGTTTGGTTTGGTTTGGNAVVSGTWQITEKLGSNTCGEPVNTIDTYQLTAVQQGSILTVTDDVGNSFTGTVSDNKIKWTGSFPQDGGTTTITSMNLIVATGAQSFSGTTTWSWTDGSFNCQGSSTITGVK